MESTDPKKKNYQPEVNSILDPENTTSVEDDIQNFYNKIWHEVHSCYQSQKQWYEKATNQQKKQRAASEYSGKGEHVINDSMIELEEGIIKEIMTKQNYVVSDSEKEKVEKILQESLAPNRTSDFEDAEHFISNGTVLYTNTEFYYDTNGALYKAFLLLLRQCARNYFWCIYLKADSKEILRYQLALNQTIHLMIEKQIFVDNLALQTFKSQTNSKAREEAETQFNRARVMVQSKLFDLQRRLKNAAEKLQEI